jgi:hypothetical protein
MGLNKYKDRSLMTKTQVYLKLHYRSKQRASHSIWYLTMEINRDIDLSITNLTVDISLSTYLGYL